MIKHLIIFFTFLMVLFNLFIAKSYANPAYLLPELTEAYINYVAARNGIEFENEQQSHEFATEYYNSLSDSERELLDEQASNSDFLKDLFTLEDPVTNAIVSSYKDTDLLVANGFNFFAQCVRMQLWLQSLFDSGEAELYTESNTFSGSWEEYNSLLEKYLIPALPDPSDLSYSIPSDCKIVTTVEMRNGKPIWYRHYFLKGSVVVNESSKLVFTDVEDGENYFMIMCNATSSSYSQDSSGKIAVTHNQSSGGTFADYANFICSSFDLKLGYSDETVYDSPYDSEESELKNVLSMLGQNFNLLPHQLLGDTEALQQQLVQELKEKADEKGDVVVVAPKAKADGTYNYDDKTIYSTTYETNQLEEKLQEEPKVGYQKPVTGLEDLWDWITGFWGKFWAYLMQFLTNLVNKFKSLYTWFGTTFIGDFEDLKLDENNLKLEKSVVTKFPFCIPFDMVNAIKFMVVPAACPTLSFDLSSAFSDFKDFDASGLKFTVDFSDKRFTVCFKIIKYFIYMQFCAGLMRITRNLIRG